MRTALSQFTQYNEVSKKVPAEAVTAIEAADLPDVLVDLIAGNLPLKLDAEAGAPVHRRTRGAPGEVRRNRGFRDRGPVSLEQEITGKVRRKLEKTQKDYFLNEQLKEIQRELGAEGEDPTGARELEEKVKAKGLPARGGGEVPEGAQAPGPHAAHVSGVGAPAHLPGMDRATCRGRRPPPTTGTSSARARSWTKTTTT